MQDFTFVLLNFMRLLVSPVLQVVSVSFQGVSLNGGLAGSHLGIIQKLAEVGFSPVTMTVNEDAS